MDVGVGEMTAAEIEAAICEAWAHQLRARFPADWDDEQRAVFVAEHAAPMVSWVITQYDNLVDSWVDWGYRHHAHSDDIAAAIHSSRTSLLDDALHPTLDELPDPFAC